MVSLYMVRERILLKKSSDVLLVITLFEIRLSRNHSYKDIQCSLKMLTRYQKFNFVNAVLILQTMDKTIVADWHGVFVKIAHRNGWRGHKEMERYRPNFLVL